MATWTKEQPCSNCGAVHGKKLQCEACRTVGCVMCLGTAGRGVCKVCKKVANRRPV